MSRRIHPVQSRAEKHAKILAALRALHSEGFPDAGPTEIGRQIDEPWCRVGGKPVAGALHTLLRELMTLGKVERVPQGERRAHYRLVEDFGS